MPKRNRTTNSIDRWSFRTLFTRKGLRNRREASESRPNAWFASLRESVWADLEQRGSLPDLEIDEILAWADAHHARAGEWPAQSSGPIPEAPGETWLAVEAALTYGLRGLPGGWTMLRLLAVHRGVYNPRDPHFNIQQILTWADAWHARTGEWPMTQSGEIPDTHGINWNIVDYSLRLGRGGLPPGSSLSRLLAADRGAVRTVCHLRFTEEQILAWADAFHYQTGQWPHKDSGELAEISGINWTTIDGALRYGRAGLAPGSSLSRLLAAKRDVVHLFDQQPLTESQILEWADAFHSRTGNWPTSNQHGAIPETDHAYTWSVLDQGLRSGRRGLPGGSSLARLLAAQRAVRNRGDLDSLVEDQVLAWADAFSVREGRWPNHASGPIPEAPGETWGAVESALSTGIRGLPGGSSLSRLLVERRGIKDFAHRPPLSVPQILAWADAHRQRSGRWPIADSGAIADASDETWRAVNNALVNGLRGLQAGSSLARLLAQERGARNKRALPPFSILEILEWADAHHARHSEWPKPTSGLIPESPAESWMKVHTALVHGLRGLPPGSSLAQLLACERRVRNVKKLPDLSAEDILTWADAHHSRIGRWPNHLAGPIPEAPGENWLGVQNALVKGMRSLPGGSSLAQFLAEHRGVRNRRRPPPLTIAQILMWADAHHERIGRWPAENSGAVADSPDDTWLAISEALRNGRRGLPAGSSLAQLLAEHRAAKPK